MMQLALYPDKSRWSSLLQRPVKDNGSFRDAVISIIEQVKMNGDAALQKFSLQYDGVMVNELLVSEKEFSEACANVSPGLKQSIDTAVQNIRRFHELQYDAGSKVIETMPGVQCWYRNLSIEKVGLYIPGGTAPLFSTLLMLGIPAKIAGCKEVVVCTPPGKDGKINPLILYAASLLGLKNIYKAGGAQAIAAMAYGTATIPRVFKIFGPGNQYVTTAKQLVQTAGVAIDMPAGPSEVCVIADETADPVYIASDLLSQAEHGTDSQVVLVTTSEILVKKVTKELEQQLKTLPRKDTVSAALVKSLAIVVKDMSGAVELVNEYAPEHLIINCANEDAVAEKIINAGSVFLGKYSPESVGDYASGTNHTLPTNGYAKAYSGVGVESFMKRTSYQRLTKEGITQISSAVIDMAIAEGLEAHANAVRVRLTGK